ncbi:hypothetical protein CASFOL_033938 [Castilleja foliolosa]|uniref:Nuclease HARBI1 n=1 Tax=Castilleja foliolosa TaxID=1961234 RepID=A0ABD3BYX9_9LAMI
MAARLDECQAVVAAANDESDDGSVGLSSMDYPATIEILQLSPIRGLVRSHSRKFVPSQADEEAHQLSYLQKHIGNILSLLADSTEGEDDESMVLSMDKFEHLGFLLYFGEKGSVRIPLSQSTPFFANSDPDMLAAPVPASQVLEWLLQNISSTLEHIADRVSPKESSPSSSSDQDVQMADVGTSSVKPLSSTRGPSFIKGISKSSCVKQAADLKGTSAKSAYRIQQRNRRDNIRGGSVLGHAILHRNRLEGHQKLYRDYFAENPVFPANIFRRRFRMNRSLFCRIHSTIGAVFFAKVTAAFRMLAYGAGANSLDEYLRIGESTTIESLRRFVNAVVEIFSDEYLRSPNENDIARLLEVGERRGFPGMLGSIDCTHWVWRNCPTAWKGMYSGHIHEPTIILEAIASYDLWIWHAFFGLPGSLNDINVLERSPLVTEKARERAPKANYSINVHDYTIGYYLADGIYPTWSIFVKTIPSPQGNKRKNFSAAQESARKDVERAFGVLKTRFAIVKGPARFWDIETLTNIMKACIIMHNMIIENEGDVLNPDFDYDGEDDNSTSTI